MGAPGLRANNQIPQHASASSSACFDGVPSSAIRPRAPPGRETNKKGKNVKLLSRKKHYENAT
eukprot:8958519-Prorocentrum_lima.AAC.1